MTKVTSKSKSTSKAGSGRLKSLPFTISPRRISVVVDKRTYNVNSSQPNFASLKKALENKDWKKIPKLVTAAAMLQSKTRGSISIQDGNVLYKGKIIHSSLTERILQMIQEKKPVKGMLAFMENLYKNPSQDSINELYDWLLGCKLPITDDGCFMAYKKIRDDYTDSHTGKIDNSPGNIVVMPRSQVNTNRREHCASGLHFCSAAYIPGMTGQKIVLLKINPRDVVSIPNDESFTKGRAWRYEVIAELSKEDVSKLQNREGDIAAMQTSVFETAKDRKSLLELVLAHPFVKSGVKKRKLKVGAIKKYTFGRLRKFADSLEKAKAQEKPGMPQGTDQVLRNPIKAMRLKAGFGLSLVADKAAIAPKTLLLLEKAADPDQADIDRVLIALTGLTSQRGGFSYSGKEA